MGSIELVRTGRRQGKTRAAVNWILEDPYHRSLVTISEMEAARVRKLIESKHAETSSIALPAHVVVGPSAERLRGLHKEIAIDNLDLLVRDLYGDVRFATWNV